MADHTHTPFSFLEFAPVAAAPLGFKPTAMNFDQPPADPVAEVHRWLAEAFQLPMGSPNAMSLATLDANGAPSVRTVLLKGFDEHGAVFFTNRLSRKGRALTAQPRAALLLFWDQLGRQIQIEGSVTPTSDAHSDAYFATRPRASRIGAWASDQSEPAADRAALDGRVRAIEARFAGVEVPRPPHWGGYRVALGSIEFWQADPFRLHDRIVYKRSSRGWNITRLFP